VARDKYLQRTVRLRPCRVKPRRAGLGEAQVGGADDPAAAFWPDSSGHTRADRTGTTTTAVPTCSPVIHRWQASARSAQPSKHRPRQPLVGTVQRAPAATAANGLRHRRSIRRAGRRTPCSSGWSHRRPDWSKWYGTTRESSSGYWSTGVARLESAPERSHETWRGAPPLRARTRTRHRAWRRGGRSGLAACSAIPARHGGVPVAPPRAPHRYPAAGCRATSRTKQRLGRMLDYAVIVHDCSACTSGRRGARRTRCLSWYGREPDLRMASERHVWHLRHASPAECSNAPHGIGDNTTPAESRGVIAIRRRHRMLDLD